MNKPTDKPTRDTDKGIEAFRRFSQGCPYLLKSSVERRPANALCVEIASGVDRCSLKPPKKWKTPDVVRWIWSGGSMYVFGACSRKCALGHRWCPECGHREENHVEGGCLVQSNVAPYVCGCTHYQGIKETRENV